MSTIALHSTLNISETVRDRGLIGSTTVQQDMAYGLRRIKSLSMTSHDSERSNSWPQYA